MRVVKTFPLIMMPSRHHQTPYYTYAKDTINRAKFDVCTPGSFKEVKRDKHKDQIVL